ncbi:Blue copper protein [Quillaja saponaria]|uniref:Blue copper protein n=1 Tax=Quillaja saponaria TaxID=32244 RepID=A0AAD7LWR7_QUISA|nr:Blue copper protein [Quillaja saponaria]
MASSNALVLGVIVIINMALPSLATVYTVGDTSGWTIGVDYSTWTSGQTFVVGDSLVFNYGGGHTVDEVSSSDYKTCTVGNSLSTDSSGATTIALKTAGSHYYLCNVIGHCGNGMKLAVDVKAAGSTTTPSATPSTTPSSDKGSPSNSNTTATTTNTPSTTTVDNSSGTTLLPIVAALIVTWVSLCLVL